MEFLIVDNNYKSEKAMNEVKGYVEDQNKFASFDSFPGVAEYIKDVLSTDKEDFIKMLWNHEKKKDLKLPVLLIRSWTLFVILLQTSAQIANKDCAIIKTTSVHPFVKYIVPIFKYLRQESYLTEFC